MSGGYVYFIEAKDSGCVKIGWAKDPQERLGQLQCGCPYELRLLHHEPGSRLDEGKAHRLYKELWIRGEWFRLDGVLKERLGPRGTLNGIIDRDLIRAAEAVQHGAHLRAHQRRRINYAIRKIRRERECWDERAWKTLCEEWSLAIKLWGKGKPIDHAEVEERVERRLNHMTRAYP